MRCYNCNTIIDISKKIGRRDICPECSSYLHCCYNCHFYDENAYHSCREPRAEFVEDKTKANFCEYFMPSEKNDLKEQKISKEKAQKLWEKYFKKDGNK